ncbi:MAG: hypothetical protein Q9185_000369 [Variospora sp. 1 TL-2023]
MPPAFIRRALSPVHFDVLQAEPDDILYPGSDIDEDPAYYRAKRRRVENAAQEYLRGKSVYIASARLRGPFPQGWRNPFTLQEEERRIIIERKQQLRQEEQRQLEGQPSKSEAHLISDDIDKAGPYNTGYPIALSGESVKDIEIAANPDVLQQSMENNPDLPAERPIVKSKEEPRLAKPSGPGNHNWLNISKTFATSNFRSGHKSATPTPLPRMWDEMPRHISARLSGRRGVKSTRTSPSVEPEPEPEPEENLQIRLNRSSMLAHVPKKPQNNRNHRSPSSQPLLPVKEIDINRLDPGNMQAYQTVKRHSQEAVHRAQDDWETSMEANKLSQDAAHRAIEVSAAVKETSSPLKQADAVANSSAAYPLHAVQSIHKVPPSTNLPAFEYRSRRASISPKRRSFREDLEAAKKKARAEEKRRISFTASGRVMERRSQTSSRGANGNRGRVASSSGLPQREVVEAISLESEKMPSKDAPRDDERTTLDQTSILREAQEVHQPGLNKVRSMPSAELLETEKQSLKFPSTDEGDSYLNLSTQAALQKAQQSFHRGLAHSPPSRCPKNLGISAIEPAVREGRLYEDSCRDASPSPTPAIFTPNANAEDMMSTQAMMNAMSPFAVTTAKKKSDNDAQSDLAASVLGSSPSLSPTAASFRATSLSMSTTPSNSPIADPAPHRDEPPVPLSTLSKPTSSTITSFSIAPNGTMTEVLQYDGQQQPQQDYQMGDSDLDAALDEAGSFLGDWSVEKEARFLQRSTAGS